MGTLLRILSPAALWGLAAALPAVTAEYLYRVLPLAGPYGWVKYLWLWVPLQLAIGYCIFRLVTIPNTTLMDSFAIWAFSTIAMRVVISVVFLHDPVKPGTWFALALILMARIAQTFWGR